VPEHWRLQVTSRNPDNPAEFLFSVSGSTTGLDGNGNSGHRFVSNSGRVTIEPSDWFPKNAASVALVGSQLEWTSELRAVDELVADADRAQIVEAATTLVSDLPDGPHVVELIAKPDADLSAILALRTYHPGGPMPGLERSLTDEPQLRVVPLGDEWLAVWPAKSAPWEGIRRDALNLPGAALQTTTERWFGFTGAKVQLEGRMGFFGIEPR
jgi:hypothetical protein